MVIIFGLSYLFLKESMMKLFTSAAAILLVSSAPLEGQ